MNNSRLPYGKFSCVVIGETSLTQKCAELIQRSGHVIQLLITNNHVLAEWAVSVGIPCKVDLCESTDILKRLQFDYLFSIVNNHIIPNAILKLPKALAINYHDALLPKYAGVNATSWAILNKEKQHGISWHVMSEKVDSGALLKQKTVVVEPDDTALLLNIKCYEVALTAFSELLVELEQGKLMPTIQNLKLRTFYGRTKRPAAAAIIDWTKPAEEIYRLYRALSFGIYENPLCSVKILLHGTFYIPGQLKISDSLKKGSPGEIMQISGSSITVATGKLNIEFGALHSLDGVAIDMIALIASKNIVVGDVLPSLTITQQRAVEADYQYQLTQHGVKGQSLANYDPIHIIGTDKRVFQVNDKTDEQALIEASPYTKLFWIEYQIDPSRHDYNIVFDQTISGPLDVKQLEKSLQCFVGDHLLVNSHLIENERGLFWEQNPNIAVLEYFRSGKTQTKFVANPFQLETGPLYRFGLFKGARNTYDFIAVFHHAVLDGNDFDAFINSLSTYYNNVQTPLDRVKQCKYIQTVNQALREKATSLKQAGSLQFWQEALRGLPAKNNLPYIKSKASVHPQLGMIEFTLCRKKYAAWNSTLQASSTFNIFALVWGILIARYSRQENAYIQYPVRVKEGAGLIYGAQINSVILPILDITSGSFAEHYQSLLTFVSSLQLKSGLKHSDLPIADIIKNCDIEQLNVGFAQTNLRNSALQLQSCVASVNHKYDLDLSGSEVVLEYETRGDHYQFCLKYRADLFTKAQMLSMQRHYLVLLKNLVSNPNTLMASQPLLSAEETQKILNDFNQTSRTFPQNKTIIDLFQAQADKTPDATAVLFEGQAVTYKTLNQKANQLARYIRKQYTTSLQEDALILLCLERSVDMIVAILSTLKAGGAYVPIDPGYPVDRIKHIVEDTRGKILLTQTDLNKKFSDIFSQVPNRIIVDQQQYNQEPKNDLPSYSSSRSLAYVIYTSGTTGLPKGVLIENIGVVNYLTSQHRYLKLNGAKKIYFIHSYAFDTAISSIFGSLCFGHCLVMTEEANKLDEENFVKYDINAAYLPPSYLASINLSAVSALEVIVVSGEKGEQSVLENLPNRVINEYGPTEASVCSTFVAYGKQEIDVSNIGMPLANKQLFIVDEQLQPVPVGVIGELFIGGVGLARGYLNNPALTTERFIKNPFQVESAHGAEPSKLYKTGDLVKRLPNGAIEYVGRNDFQVKIRGFRVELGEIETVLSRHPAIQQAAVLLQEGGEHSENRTQKLVAYYVAEQVILEESLLQHLRASLPDYMVPKAFMRMEHFPVTINGKLDREALCKVDFPETHQRHMAPSTTLEYQLCKIWCKVLGLEQVGIRDDFFSVGGDSILSIQVASALRKLDYNCSVKAIFECRTIESLAKHLEASADAAEIIVEQGTLTGEFGLLPIQSWFFEKVKSGQFKSYQHWNQAFLIKVPVLEVSKLNACLEKLANYHDILRADYRKSDVQGKQHYNATIVLPELKQINISTLSDQERIDVLTKWQSQFSIESGPLWQVGYLTGYEDGSARIFFAAHHLVIDAVSWRILVEDLQHLYHGEMLPQKSSSYRQWVASVKNYAQSHTAEIGYWKDQMSSLPEHEPTVERTKLGGDDIAGSYGGMSLCQEKTKTLLQGINGAYHTEVNDILLTALAYALQECQGNRVHGITLEGHGREFIDSQIDVSRTVGWFTTLYPVSLLVKATLGESIKGIKEGLRKIPNKGIGYGALLPEHQKDLPPISFNYLGQFDVQGEDWQITAELPGRVVGQGNDDSNLININGMVVDGRLNFSIVTQPMILEAQKLADTLEKHLLNIIEHCEKVIAEKAQEYTPSDFTSVSISQPLLDQLQHEAKVAGNEIESIYPANSLQQGFIYHALSQPSDDAYRVQILLDYKQVDSIEAYLQAWELVIQTYPILRTAFNWEAEPIQICYKRGQLNYQIHDLTTYNKKGQAAEIKRIQEQDRRTHFDLQKAPLVRLHIFKLANMHYVVLKSIHHSISDGWSSQVLLSKLHDFYRAIQSDDVIVVQEETVYQQAQAYYQTHKTSQIQYWQEKLGTIEAANDISPLLDAKINVEQTRVVKSARSTYLTVDSMRAKKLQTLAKRQGTTLSSLIQFSWHKLLSVYTQDKQTIVGTTVSGRDLPIYGIAESVGLYINTLPVIMSWDDQAATISDQLEGVHQEITALNHHSFINLATLQQESRRLFHSLFVFANYPVADRQTEATGSLTATALETIEKLDYPIALIVHERAGKLQLELKHDANLLTDRNAKKHLSTLENILAQMPEKMGQSHDSITVLPEEDQQQCMLAWNQTHTKFPHDETIHALFQRQAKKTPQQIAAVFEDVVITYKELDEQSNQLARYIRKRYQNITQKAFMPGILVALCCERSLEMIIAILGVLKAGGAYVPIDPDFPNERISYICRDAKASMILSQTHLESILTSALGEHTNPPELVMLDNEPHLVEDKTALSAYSKATDLAYVIYTSGTTGQPKGSLTSHRGLVNRLHWMGETYQFNGTDRVLQKTPYIFDVSVWELLLPIITGARLVFAKPGGHKDPAYLHRFIVEQQITKLHFVPSMLQAYLTFYQSISDQGAVLPLLDVFCSGEALPATVAAEFKRYFPNVRLHNLYGPTEVAIDVTAFNNIQGDETFIPIGRPIQNVKCYVLGENLQPLPVGVIGELYLRGADTLHGYLNKSDLTAEKFIPNLFASEDEKKRGLTNLYKTGDLVRWLPDGNLEYIGRNDFQVKIRGLRIELGEIENALASYTGVKQATVLAKEKSGVTGEMHQYLIAYYVCDQKVEEHKLLEHLARKLPEYMVPSHIVKMDAFPITINGKLDRRALPEPQMQAEQTEYTRPTTALESKFCHIWQEVLGLKQVGIQDDFFKIGGNSILAMQVSFQVSKASGTQIGIADIFRYKTVQQLANFASEQSQREIVIPQYAQSLVPLSFAQERLWFIEQYEGGTNAYHIPMLLELELSVVLPLMEEALQYLVVRHQVLRSVFMQDQQGRDYQVVKDDPLQAVYRVALSAQQLQSALQKDINQIFDLTKEYPIRVVIYTSSDGATKILVNIHHIAFDGWSVDVFLEELEAVYTALSKQSVPQLPALPIQYKDFAGWQKNVLADSGLKENVVAWKEKLQGIETLAFPTDYSRPAKLNYAGQDAAFTIENDTHDKLKALAEEQGCTLYTVLLSGFYILLHQYTGQDNIAVGTPMANRHSVQLENLVGFFVNSLPIVQNLQPNQSARELISALQQTVLETQSYQDVPFEKIVEALGTRQDQSRHPIFQTMFSLQSFGERDFPHFKKLATETFYNVAKFDLSLFLSEKNGALRGTVNYATALFKESTIKRLILHYQHILAQLAVSTHKPLIEYQLVTAEEQEKMQLWNQTDRSLPHEQCLHEPFMRMANRYPEAPAIMTNGRTLTYKELDAFSDNIAHQLSNIDSVSAVVGICLPKGWEQVVACIGVLKAGLAFLPLSIDDPVDRIGAILKQAGATTILGDIKANAQLIHQEGLIRLDFNEAIQVSTGVYRAKVKAFPTDLAYVIFTSGSTGMPKGVMISHQSALNTIFDINEKFKVTKDDVAFGISAFNFDLSIYDIFGLLAVGGRLVLPDSNETKDPACWWQYFQAQKITIWNSVPALMQLFVDFLERQTSREIKRCLESLRLIMLSGDWIPLSLPDKIKRYANDDNVKVISLGGATEASIWSIYYPIHSMDHDWTSIPYGKPLANQRFYVLNSAFKAMPVGVEGDLYIAGLGLAQGYLNDEQKTQQSFITHPETGERLYRTGDLGRYLPDGNIEFCGRRDFQVKVRGFRIELGEIEQALLQGSQIDEAIILPYGSGSNCILIGFLTLKPGAGDFASAQARELLKKRVPEYMIPQDFMFLDEIPLTANGKIDRKNLLADYEENGVSEIAEQYTDESLTPLEVELRDIWSDLLDGVSINKSSSFFALGGHSLLITKLSWAISDRLNIEVSLMDLFEHPHLVEQAAFLQKIQQQKEAASRPIDEKQIIEGAF